MAELEAGGKPRKAPKQDVDTLATQWDSFDRAVRGTKKWADGDPIKDMPGARMCQDFLNGNQWALADLLIRQQDKRPSITINRIKPIVQSARGFFRNNRYELKYLPGTDGTGSQATAETLSKLSKGTDEECKTKWIDAQVFDDGLTTGRGYWDIRLSFADNVLGRVSERALNPFRTHPDPEADSYDPTDWNEVTCEHWMTHNDIEQMYGRVANEVQPLLNYGIRRSPGALLNAHEDTDTLPPLGYFGQFASLSESENMYNLGHTNGLGEVAFYEHFNALRRLFRVIDRQHYRRKRVKRLIDPVTGQFRVIPDNWDRNKIARLMEKAAAMGAQLMVDDMMKRMVRWTVTCLDVVLFDDWSPYETFTVVPFFPDFQRGLTRGLIHDLIHPQQEVNVKRSAQMHIMNLTANPGWIWGKGVLDDDNNETMLRDGARPGVQIQFDVEKAKEAGKPARIAMGEFPIGLERLEKNAGDDIEYIAGFNKAAMGQLDRVQSGRAIEARTRAAMVGLEPYFDAFGYSTELKGRKRLELYQDFYTEPRIMMLTTDPEAPPEVVQINQQAADGVINGISDGTYTAVVDQVPISKSYLDGVFQEAMEIVEKMPGLIPGPDLLKLSSLPGKTEMIRKAQETAKNAPPPPEVMKEQNAAKLLEFKGQELQQKTQQAPLDAANKKRELDIKDKSVEYTHTEKLLAIDVQASVAEVKANAQKADEIASSADRIIKLLVAGKGKEAQVEAANIKASADTHKTNMGAAVTAATHRHEQLLQGSQQQHDASQAALGQAHEADMAAGAQDHQAAMAEGQQAHDGVQAMIDRLHQSAESGKDRTQAVTEGDKTRQHQGTQAAAERKLKSSVAATGALSKITTSQIGAKSKIAAVKAKPKPAAAGARRSNGSGARA